MIIFHFIEYDISIFKNARNNYINTCKKKLADYIYIYNKKLKFI